MPEQRWHFPVVLSTARIFDDTVYLREALHLPVNQSEDDLDAALALLARESGIQDPYRYLPPPPDVSRALSTMTADSDHRSSVSIHSHETQSTSFTSAPSRTSRDHLYASERSPAPRALPKAVRASLSVESPVQSVDDAVPVLKQGRSALTLSIAPSALSNSSPLQDSTPRRKRGSGLFAMFRKDSSSCTSRSHHGHHSRSRGTKLDCGHSLSPFAIRVHIQEALQSGAQTRPSCCGTALPRPVLAIVLTDQETDLITEGTLQSHDVDSLGDSGYSENGLSSVPSLHSPKATPSTATTPEPSSAPLRRARHEAINVDSALANEAFKSFRAQQKEQLERVSAFECNQRKALSAHHQCSLKQLAAQHGRAREERMEQHTYDLEHMEERQIVAEHDLRKAQAQETQNVATALKHMEAYCLGTNVNHPEHAHTVSEEDFRKLDRQRLFQQNLPRKHGNAINVLRAKQERDSKQRLLKQDAELDQLDITGEKEENAEKSAYSKEVEKLETIIEARRKRLLQRWDLKFEMWRRDWEEQHHTTLSAKLEHEEWRPRKADHATKISDSSALAQYIKATG